MAKPIELARVHGAAYHFAFISRDKAEIAHYLGLTERTIQRYAKMDAFQRALDIYGYSGDRTFLKRVTRDASRDSAGYKRAKSVYKTYQNRGVYSRSLARRVSEATGIPVARIRSWAKQYNWFDECHEE